MAKPLFPDLVVNGETVPAALVAAEAQHHQAPKGKPGVAWRKAAEAIAIRTLLLQEARRLGLEARPDEIGPGQFETKEAALIGQLLDSAVEVNPPDEATIRAEWERVPERFARRRSGRSRIFSAPAIRRIGIFARRPIPARRD